EEVLALGPDVLLDMTTLTKQTAAKADELQAQTGVPVLVVSFDLLHIGESYRFVGPALTCANKAETLAAFCDALIADIGETSAAIAGDDRVTFYYTAGGAGLQTAPAGSNHTELIEFAGGLNVVNLPAENNGRLKVDMERILAWQPDVIIASTPDILKPVLQWEQVNAVAEGKAYTAPTAPFPWLDAPVSVNRIIGLCWAAETLYPDVYGYDLAAYTKEFYSLFYGADLTDEAVEALLP
ncbi:MAG: ABC transporter substrate-binding protein, partial [Firmicutes bacterium]|nr:ABC transporter substrate-binding protein [Bacillota bacterium]